MLLSAEDILTESKNEDIIEDKFEDEFEDETEKKARGEYTVV
jgi:hypothetical protein